MEPQQKHQFMLTQLVMIFHAAAMQQMGKVKNPLTDTIEVDLVAAQGSIDMLDMLKEKTRGNLSAEEERFLSDVLRDLKLNYVDEVNKAQSQAAKKPEEQGTS